MRQSYDTFSLNFARFLDRLAFSLPWCLYALGAGMLVAKVSGWWGRIAASFPFFVVAMVVGAGFVYALPVRKKDRYDEEFVKSWLDLHNHAGGGVISGVPGAAGHLRVRPGATFFPLLSRLLFPALFMVAACLAPASEPSVGLRGTGIARALARAEERIELAREFDVLPQPAVDELRRQLEGLRELAESHPEAAAEALAALPERVDAAVARRLERGADAVAKSLAAWRELAAGVEATDAEAADSPGLEARLSELSESLDALVREEGGLDRLPEELRGALSEVAERLREGSAGAEGRGAEGAAGLDREVLEKVMRALAERGEGLCRGAEACSASGSGQGEAGEPGGTVGVGRLSDALAELAGALAVAGGEPGAGGVDRGPGDAPLTFGAEARADGELFNYAALPEAGDALPGVLLERERAAPPEDAPEEEPSPVARSGAAARGVVFSGGGRGTLAPERARAAERYFRSLGEKSGREK